MSLIYNRDIVRDSLNHDGFALLAERGIRLAWEAIVDTVGELDHTFHVHNATSSADPYQYDQATEAINTHLRKLCVAAEAMCDHMIDKAAILAAHIADTGQAHKIIDATSHETPTNRKDLDNGR